MKAIQERREDVVMALLGNNIALSKHGNYSRSQLKAYSSSCFCVLSVSGL